jgi:hypothetical protein
MHPTSPRGKRLSVMCFVWSRHATGVGSQLLSQQTNTLVKKGLAGMPCTIQPRKKSKRNSYYRATGTKSRGSLERILKGKPLINAQTTRLATLDSLISIHCTGLLGGRSWTRPAWLPGKVSAGGEFCAKANPCLLHLFIIFVVRTETHPFHIPPL